MFVRIATVQDKKQVLHLFDEFSSLLKTPEMPSQIGEKIFDEIIKRNDTKIFVAEENGKLFGLVTFYLLPNIRHGQHRGHIEDMFVSYAYRGKGIGTKLLDAIKKYCRQNHIKVFKLDSGKALTDAHKFYEKNGGKTNERFFRFDIEP